MELADPSRAHGMYRIARPLLFLLKPDLAQSVAMAGARIVGMFSPSWNGVGPGRIEAFGLSFANRVGLAAGFDKSGTYIDVLGKMGFGAIEVGTITPRPQSGSSGPRVFRLIDDRALINRMGFNNDGATVVARRLERRRYTGICGVNIGKNFDTPIAEAARDYVACFEILYAAADYFTLNISSPNTTGLRGLQEPEPLRALMLQLMDARERLMAIHGKRVPVLLKVAPDLTSSQLGGLVEQLQALKIDGIVATNTTVQRPATLRSPYASEHGGLSGVPLHAMSVEVIRTLRAHLGCSFPIIGAGGISSVESACAVRDAGATLIQLYTGLVYQGPRLVKDLVSNLP